jgi:hypothetical protein
MGYMQRRRFGDQMLHLYETTPDRKLRHVVPAVPSSDGTFIVGTVKERGTGAILDALYLEETVVVTGAVIGKVEYLDLVGEGRSLRYSVEDRTPPRGLERTHVLTIRLRAGDETEVLP